MPVKSQQNRPRNYQISGYYRRKRATMRRGMAAIDGRSTEGRAALQWRNEVLKALGGQKRLSPQRSMLANMLTVKVYRWLVLSAWITTGKKDERMLNRRKRTTWPVVKELDELEASINRDLDRLGWDRRQPNKFPWMR